MAGQGVRSLRQLSFPSLRRWGRMSPSTSLPHNLSRGKCLSEPHQRKAGAWERGSGGRVSPMTFPLPPTSMGPPLGWL